MNILILNRRDTGNPLGGGAEVYTHEIAKGLTARGCSVTLFTSAFAGSKAEETIDGILHIRRGGELTVHFHGFLHALRNRKRFDLIIDEYNGLGFMCFMFRNSALLIYQMYREFWFRELGKLGALPYIIEPWLIKLYRRRPVVTISGSTVADLRSLGFRGDISVVLVAIENAPLPAPPTEREQHPTLLFLSRLRSTKRPEDAIRIYRLVKERVPEVRLWFAGRGPEEARLKALAASDPDITFHGFVDEETKFRLMQRAHVLVVPGVREGFGINVVEAASMGTPAVGYNVHGLRDSIRDGQTGLLATGPEDAAAHVMRLLGDTALYKTFADNCIQYSREFTWARRAGEFHEFVLKAARR